MISDGKWAKFDTRMEFIMGSEHQGPVYTGMDKYPGIISTILTIVIGAVFMGALFMSASAPH